MVRWRREQQATSVFLPGEPLEQSVQSLSHVQLFVQEAVIKTIPKQKRRNKAKWLSQEALQIAEKKTSEAKDKGEKERYNHLNAEELMLLNCGVAEDS